MDCLYCLSRMQVSLKNALPFCRAFIASAMSTRFLAILHMTNVLQKGFHHAALDMYLNDLCFNIIIIVDGGCKEVEEKANVIRAL